MGDDSSSGQPRRQVGDVGPVQLANCRDWKRGTPQQREGTVRELREFAGGSTGSPGRRGATLDDDRAYELLDDYCRRDFARGFKLYKLYTRAAALRRLHER